MGSLSSITIIIIISSKPFERIVMLGTLFSLLQILSYLILITVQWGQYPV